MRELIRITQVLICCSVFFFHAYGQQTPYLEKPVTIKYGTYSYADLFKQFSNQTGVVFSYTNFDDSKKVTTQFAKRPLRIALNELFNVGDCTYKMKGKYVILTCKTVIKPKEPSKETMMVNGYIYNAVDSTLIGETSVYLKQNRQSAITNEFGYFSMNFTKTSDVLSISVAKENFEDTTVVILSKQRNTLVIYLNPKAPATKITVNDSITVVYTPKVDTTELVSELDSIAPAPFDFWNRFRSRHANVKNIRDTLFTKYSFSFVHPLSTNGLLSINTVNQYSFNGLVGYSKGIDKFEIGGLVNLDYGNVKYVQVAGIANLVSGNSTGFQMGGILNAVGGDVSGVQLAGILNIDRGNVSKVQVAGIGNTVFGSVSGVQIGGIFNINWKHTDGFQGAGIYNQTISLEGTQVAGIANMTWRKATGIQLAGIVNTADSMVGAQVAGIANNANYVKGFQLSGIINRADHVDGTQVSLVNIANSTSGVPIGLLSYVHKGYHKIELALDEQLMSTVSFRTGVNAFHNIFIAGAQFSGSNRLWTFGYGLGSAIKLSKSLFIDFDLTAQNLVLVGSNSIGNNRLSKFYVGVEYRIWDKFSIAAGPTLNWLNADSGGVNYGTIQSRLAIKSIASSVNGSFSNQLWIGGKIAIRIL